MKTPSLPQKLFLLGAGFTVLQASPVQAVDLQDNFASAPDLTGALPITHTGDTTAATAEVGPPAEPLHSFNAVGGSVWGTFATSVDGVYVFSTAGSSFDTVLGVYVPGGDFASFERLGANNNVDGLTPTATTTSLSRVFIPAGEVVAVAVDGDDDAGTTARGTVSLTISLATTTDPNDNFANATNLGGAIPVNATSSNLNASREFGEPIHGIDDANPGTTWGGTSVWFRWTAPATQDVIFSTAGSTTMQTGVSSPLDTLLAVYTSTFPTPTLAQLTTVAENNNTADLTSAATVAVTAGTVYYIAVDGRSSTSTFEHRGSIALSIAATPDQAVFGFGSNWEYLQTAVDPVDEPVFGSHPGFHTSWFSHAEGFSVAGANPYDGPAFSGPSPGLFSGPDVGLINFDTTDNTDLPQANKETFYVRKRFNLPTAVNVLGAEIVADDGAIIYIDGVEKNRINMGTALEGYTTPAAGVGNEDASTRLSLGALAAGDHVIAVSVHNTTDFNNGSDIGFDLRLYTDTRAPSITSSLSASGSVGSPFTYQIGVDPAIPAASYGATGLPAGLTIDTVTGIISGTPTTQGQTVATITATNGNGTDTESLTINVSGPFGDVTLASGATVGTGFEEPARLATGYVRGSNGTAEIGFTFQETDAGATAIIDVRDPTVAGDHPAVGDGTGSGPPHTAPPDQYLRIVDAVFNTPFRTDKINISGLTAAEKSDIEVRVDIRTFTTSATVFEGADALRIFVEGSADGVTFSPLGDLLNATADQLINYRHDDGTYTTLSSAGLVTITSDINTLRLVVELGVDSGSEYIYLDNIEFEASTGTPPADDFFITSVNKVGSNGLIGFNAEVGSTYRLEGSSNLQTWTQVQGTIDTLATSTAGEFIFTWPGTTEYYVRVRKM